MPVHTMHCQDPWFTKIKEGIKPVEGRKGKEIFRRIKPGDTIQFTNGSESFNAKVSKVDTFSNVEEYLEKVGVEKALPGIKSIEEGLEIYYQWSTPEEIDELGFLGIWVKPE